MADTYQCSVCGGVFEKGRSDDEAMAESRERFGTIPVERMAVACDDCFRAMFGEHGEALPS